MFSPLVKVDPGVGEVMGGTNTSLTTTGAAITLQRVPKRANKVNRTEAVVNFILILKVVKAIIVVEQRRLVGAELGSVLQPGVP